MCFHFSISRDIADIKDHYQRLFGLDDMEVDDSDFDKIFHANAFTFPLLPVVTAAEPQRLQFFHWGLIPKWQKSREEALKFRSNTLNARSETIFEKASFRASIMQKRCLVPTTGFFESLHVGKKTYPFFIGLRSHDIFSFGAIHEEWLDKESGEIFKTFSICTHAAAPLIAKIHNTKERQPLMLSGHAEEQWLNTSLDKEAVQALFHSVDDEQLEAHSVSKLLHSQREYSNIPEVLDTVEYPELRDFSLK